MSSGNDTTSSAVGQFHALLQDTLASHHFIRLLLTKPCGAELDLERIEVRPLTLRGVPSLSVVYRYKTRDITKNHPQAEGVPLIHGLLGTSFRNAHLFIQDEEILLAFSKKGKPAMRHSKAHHETKRVETHDREKQRYVEIERPFLTELGVTDQQRQLIPAMSRKWKQLNKFIEVFQNAFDASELTAKHPVSVVDFGSGKGYLTFAIHDFLRHTRGLDAQVMGVELRENLTTLCNSAVEKLQLEGLYFRQGDVRHFAPQQLDVMIALHACDTGTDYAIHMGIRSSASTIMCAPCCRTDPPADAQPAGAAADAAIRRASGAGGGDGNRRTARPVAGSERLRYPGVRIHFAGAHQQEQDDPRCEAAPAARRAGDPDTNRRDQGVDPA